MDFINRGPQHNVTATGASSNSPLRRGGKGKFSKLLAFATTGMLFSIAVLSVAVLLGIVFSKDARKEEDNVDPSKYQIVVIGEQSLVYYGKITSINRDYLTLADVFYVTPTQLQTDKDSQTTAANNYTLIKQGCEIYGPSGGMVIRRDSVVFWQNLKSDGKVAKGIAEHKQKFPNGQQCTDATAPATSEDSDN